MELSAADVVAGSKTFSVTIYDDDYFGNDLLQTVAVTVSAANGVAGMYTSFKVTANLLNIGHEVAGTAGISGEKIAQVFFETLDGTQSNIVNIEAD